MCQIILNSAILRLKWVMYSVKHVERDVLLVFLFLHVSVGLSFKI